MPWADRGDGGDRPAASPRSQRDLDLLRALARRINAQDPGAHNNLGVVFYNKGLYDEAVAHFERALEIDPRMQVAERNLQIAYFGTGHFERLTTELRARLQRDPEDDDARDRLARACSSGSRFSEAVEVLGQMLQRRPEDPDLYQRLARVELKRGNLDRALVALRYAEHLDASSARTQFMIGEVFYHRGLSGEALGPLERAVALDDTLADAHHLLAFVYGDLDDDRAEQSAARAAQLNPSYARSDTGLSLDSYSTARYEELVGGREDNDPGVAEGGELAHYNLGLAFRQKALYDEALREFRLATERGEDTYLVQQAEAEMLLLRGDSADAAALYTTLIESESASPKLWNELGVARHQSGSLESAEEAYRRALEVDPHYALAWNNLGVARHHRGFGGAEAAFRSAVEEARAPADVWRNYALMLHREGRHGESAQAYERAMAANRASASAYTGFGVLLLEMGRPEDARRQLLRAVEIDPELAEARYQLAFALSALGDYAGALRETRLALERSPYIPVPRFRLLIDLQFEEASILAPELDSAERISGAEIVRSFEFHPESLDGVFDDVGPASRSTQAAGRPGDELLESARTALDRGLLMQADADARRAGMYGARRIDVLLLQGEVFLRRGFSGEAVERFNEALAEITRDSDGDDDDALRRALHGAARALMDLGRLTEAVEASERLCELVPSDVEALRTFGEALFRVQDCARAALVLERARAAAPDDANLLTQLGEVYAAADDAARAESSLRRAIDLDDLAVAARSSLGDLLAAAGRDDEARNLYSEALDRLPSHGQAAFGLARLEQSRGRPRLAIHVMADLLTLDSFRLDALVRLGNLLVEVGEPEKARVAYDRVVRLDPTHDEARAALDRLAPSVPKG